MLNTLGKVFCGLDRLFLSLGGEGKRFMELLLERLQPILQGSKSVKILVVRIGQRDKCVQMMRVCLGLTYKVGQFTFA